jgi:hypothetical protein
MMLLIGPIAGAVMIAGGRLVVKEKGRLGAGDIM